jgi:hypothetical protein
MLIRAGLISTYCIGTCSPGDRAKLQMIVTERRPVARLGDGTPQLAEEEEPGQGRSVDDVMATARATASGGRRREQPGMWLMGLIVED